MDTRTKHTKRLTEPKLRPLAYWASPRRFNLTALLQSGRFYLDEAGLLVAPNGTKYRIPSGPPEGRKPLRPDRPVQERFEPTRQGDLFTSEQQDSTKLSQWGVAKTPQLQDDSNFPLLSSQMKSTPNAMNQTITSPGKSSLIGSDGTIDSVIPSVAHLDWNVILLTVILSSIALVCNLALVVFLSWKINCFRMGSRNRLRSTMPQRGHSNPLVHIQSNLLERSNPTQCHCLHDGMQSSTEPARTNEHSYGTKLGACPAHMTERDPLSLQTRLSRRYRHRRGRRRRRPTSGRRLYHGFREGDPLMNYRDPLHMDPKARILRTEMSLLGDLGPATPFLNTIDRVEVGSSSGGSWHMVVSDGMISETTADEEDNNEENTTTGGDSGTNSDILYRGQRHATRSRRSATNRGFHRSDSTPEDIGRVKKLGAVMAFANGSRNMRMDAKRNRLDTIRSDHCSQFGCGSSVSRSNSSSSVEVVHNRSVLLRNISPNVTNYLCHSLGIHLGLLGIILSLIQLIVVCSALSRRMAEVNHNGVHTGSYLSEFGCVMATSLAADTLLCARQYVLAAILLVFWTTSYITLVGHITQGNPKTTLSSFCLVKPSGIREQNLGTIVQDDGRRQQRYAYLALTHSLPWAVAAGTALLITFALPSIPVEDNAPGVLIKLNLFFHGLDSLLVCKIDTKYLSWTMIADFGVVERNSTSSTNGAFAAQHWLAWSLLMFIPLCIHVLLSIVYAILIRLGMRQVQDVKRLRCTKSETSRIVCYVFGSLLALISLEYLSCAVPIVWSMFNSSKTRTASYEQQRPSPFVHRLIILHLLLDPWLIACLIRPIMTQMMHSLNQKQGVDNSQTSELALRSWTNEPPSQENPENSAYRSEGIDLAGRPISSVGFMGCFPVTGRIPNADTRGMAVSATGQAMLMPCVPNTNFYVSPLQTLSHSTELDNELFLPLNERSIRVSQCQSNALAVGPYPSNHGSLSMSMTIANPTRSPIIDSLASVQPTSPTTTGTDVFPQLCEHHQKLLEQHYAVRLPGPTPGTISSTPATTLNLGQVRAFGQVPRINPANLNFTDPLMMKSIIRVTPDDSCTISASATEPVSSANTVQQNCPIFEQSPSSDEPGKYVPTRPAAGQSQATAAVMAAAAAAVAAQAGTMSRSNTEHTGADLTQSSALSPQTLPQSQQQTSTELKKPTNHSNLSSTAHFRTTEGQHQTYSNDLIQQE